MITEDIIQSVSQHLFSEEGVNVYAVLDGASVDDLLSQLFSLQPEYECLYRGELAPDMAEVAPYLVRLEPGAEFTNWLIEQGWGKHWGIFVTSDADLRAVRRHFRTFLIVHNSDGKPLYFRYYDPRVLRVFLPTCNAEELASIFGPINYYLLEDEDPHTLLRFQFAAGSLNREKRSLAEEG